MFRSAAGCLQTHATAIVAGALQRLFISDGIRHWQTPRETLMQHHARQQARCGHIIAAPGPKDEPQPLHQKARASWNPQTVKADICLRVCCHPIPRARISLSTASPARQASGGHGGAPPSSMTSISRSVSTRDCDSFVPRSLPTYQGVRTRGDAGCPAGFAVSAGGSEGALGAAGSACCSKYLWRPTTLRYDRGAHATSWTPLLA